MRTELLFLVPDEECFCSNKKAFVDFLKVDSLISVVGQKINFRRTEKSKDVVSARFRVETNKVKSKQERYFILTLECGEDSAIDEFGELCGRIRLIGERISPGRTAVNTIWDDVGRVYAERAYPLINEVENLLRRLIAKFMLITVGVNWSRDVIHPELFKKIEKFDDPEPYINDLHKLDFIHLKQVLFEKKRDIGLDELDRLLVHTAFNDDDKEKIKRYVPRSNWEKYFSVLLDGQDEGLEKKWEILYKLRNKVAHNRNVTKDEFEKIKGLVTQVRDIIAKASAKIGEIDINAEDRELIIYSYNSESLVALGFVAEKAVAEYYAKSGYEVTPVGMRVRSLVDFYASRDGEKIGVDVKLAHPYNVLAMLRMTAERHFRDAAASIDENRPYKLNVVVVLRSEVADFSMDRMFDGARRLVESFDGQAEVCFGFVDAQNTFNVLSRIPAV